MKISDDTSAAVDFLDHRTGHALRKKSDLAVILEIGISSEDADTFNSLVFSGKVAWNLYSRLRTLQPNSDGYQQMEAEFGRAVNDIRVLLADAAHKSNSSAVAERFQQTYLEIGPGVLRNIIDLAHDLARIKDMQNDNRYSAEAPDGSL